MNVFHYCRWHDSCCSGRSSRFLVLEWLCWYEGETGKTGRYQPVGRLPPRCVVLFDLSVVVMYSVIKKVVCYAGDFLWWIVALRHVEVNRSGGTRRGGTQWQKVGWGRVEGLAWGRVIWCCVERQSGFNKTTTDVNIFLGPCVRKQQTLPSTPYRFPHAIIISNNT